MKRDDGPTYEELVQEILMAAGGPVAVDGLVDEVLAHKVTTSKNPRQLVRSKLREFAGGVLVYLDAGDTLPGPRPRSFSASAPSHLRRVGRLRLPVG